MLRFEKYWFIWNLVAEGWDTGVVRFGRISRGKLEAWAVAIMDGPGGFPQWVAWGYRVPRAGEGVQKRGRGDPCEELWSSKVCLHCNFTLLFHKYALSLYCTSATVLSVKELKKKWVTRTPTVMWQSSQASCQIAPQTTSYVVSDIIWQVQDLGEAGTQRGEGSHLEEDSSGLSLEVWVVVHLASKGVGDGGQ